MNPLDKELCWIAAKVRNAITHNSGWRVLGDLMREARDCFVTEEALGQWVKDQNFRAHPSTLLAYRYAAEHNEQDLPSEWNVIFRMASLSEAQQQDVLRRIESGEYKVLRSLLYEAVR